MSRTSCSLWKRSFGKMRKYNLFLIVMWILFVMSILIFRNFIHKNWNKNILNGQPNNVEVLLAHCGKKEKRKSWNWMNLPTKQLQKPRKVQKFYQGRKHTEHKRKKKVCHLKKYKTIGKLCNLWQNSTGPEGARGRKDRGQVLLRPRGKGGQGETPQNDFWIFAFIFWKWGGFE